MFRLGVRESDLENSACNLTLTVTAEIHLIIAFGYLACIGHLLSRKMLLHSRIYTLTSNYLHLKTENTKEKSRLEKKQVYS